MYQGDEIHRGRVRSWSKKEGYGFINITDGFVLLNEKNKPQDIFVHFSDVVGYGIRNLYEGQEVKFVLHRGNRGYVAYYVQPLTAWWE